MNILILSAGTRDKVVQYFKKEIGEDGRIVATDCSNLAPAAYEADKFHLVGRINTPGLLSPDNWTWRLVDFKPFDKEARRLNKLFKK